MKQYSILLAFLTGITSLSSCSDDDPDYTKVPDQVKQEFQARFPGVDEVQWDVVKNYHVARFNAPTRSSGKTFDSSAWFTTQGQFCQEDRDLEFDELPLLVREAFTAYKTKFYPSYEVDDCEILERAGMARIYVVEIESGNEEREISVSEMGDILKDVLDDDDEDEVLPIEVPQQIYAALQNIFPDTYQNLSILELEIDDDEIEIDVIEDNRHKEIELNAQYQLVSIEYEVTLTEARALMEEEVFQKLVAMATKAGIDLFDESLQDKMEIEVKQTHKGNAFEVEIEINGVEFEVEIDENGNFVIDD